MNYFKIVVEKRVFNTKLVIVVENISLFFDIEIKLSGRLSASIFTGMPIFR